MSTNQELIEKINTDLQNAIKSQPELVRIILNNVRPQLGQLLDTELAKRITKVYITGCGDSYFAGVATELAFHQFAGVDVQPVEALNFSRYLVPYIPDTSLLIAISNSGKVSRTIESAQRAGERIETLAITDAPQSGLAAAAKRCLFPHIPKMPSGGAGTRSYLASLLSLYAVSVHLGTVRGHLDPQQSDELWAQLENAGELISESLQLSSEAVDQYARASAAQKIFFTGGGPNYGTAMFGAAKVMEALSLEGIPVELEEWAHLQFHTTFDGAPYVMIVPPGAGYDRALEQAMGIKNSGGQLAVIVDKEDRELSALADHVFRVATPPREALTPLTYCLPTEWLAVRLAVARNTSMRMRLDENRKQVNFQQIFHSDVRSGNSQS